MNETLLRAKLVGAAIALFAVGDLAAQSGSGPAITSLSPNAATAGGPAFPLTVNGTGYVTGSEVQWNAPGKTTVLAPTSVSPTNLTVTVTADLIANPGYANVAVKNNPGGAVSSPTQFAIYPPSVTITSLNPNSAAAGGPGFSMTVNGTGYVTGSVVEWDGTALTTTYVSGTKLTALVTANLIANPGYPNVTVMDPGGAFSNAVAFAVRPTAPALTLSDNLGNSVTIDAIGTANCTGSCATAISSGSPGAVTWAGQLGVFTISAGGGQSKPALPPSQVNLALRITTGSVGSSGANPTLHVGWSDAGFSGSGPVMMTTDYSSSGPVSVQYTGYVDNTNASFGTGTTVGTLGPFSSGTTTTGLTGTIMGAGPTNQPFSMTEALTVTMGPNASFTLTGFSLIAAPAPPLTLGCPVGSGQVGVAYSSVLSPGGGVPPYSFSVGGGLPPGFTLNPATGQISGTPGAPGTFSFTAQAIDSSGNPGSNTVQSQCGIVIATPPAPLSLACPAGKVEQGAPFSSSLVASGGKPPYTFFISSGSLPPGLALNPSTGAISGDDTTATGTFAFTADAMDPSGNAAANAAHILCLLLAAAPSYNVAPKPGTTPQNVVVGSKPNNPLAVKVTKTDPATNKQVPVQGVEVTFSVIYQPGPGGNFLHGVFSNPPLNTIKESVPVKTGKDGIATASWQGNPDFQANGIAGGPYNVSAEAQLPDQSVIKVPFKLTNLAGPPNSITTNGAQTTQVNTAFKNRLTVNVTDVFGNPVPDFPVTFTPPPSGSGPGVTIGAVGVLTDKNGIASLPVTANTKAGAYEIAATAGKVTAMFAMTNTPGPLAKVIQIPPQNDPTVVVQTKKDVNYGMPYGTYFAKINTAYSSNLEVQVTDQFDNPLNGTVTFTSKINDKKAGASFKANNPDNISKKITGPDGKAKADTLTANGTTGGFPVDVSVTVKTDDSVTSKTNVTSFSMVNKGM